jgi:hypothetical protein
MEVSDHIHALASLTLEKEPHPGCDPEPVVRGGEEKNSLLSRESNPGRTARSLVTILTELHGLLLLRVLGM